MVSPRWDLDMVQVYINTPKTTISTEWAYEVQYPAWSLKALIPQPFRFML
jgi:hypothetical protein